MRTVLNNANEGIFLISVGREFQRTGADAEKALLPYVWVLTDCTVRRFCKEERRLRAGVCW